MLSVEHSYQPLPWSCKPIPQTESLLSVSSLLTVPTLSLRTPFRTSPCLGGTFPVPRSFGSCNLKRWSPVWSFPPVHPVLLQKPGYSVLCQRLSHNISGSKPFPYMAGTTPLLSLPHADHLGNISQMLALSIFEGLVTV